MKISILNRLLSSGLSFLFLVFAIGMLPQINVHATEKIGVVRADGVLHVNANEAALLIAQKPMLVILDVRTPAEFSEGHIQGAINIDYYGSDFKKNLSALDKGVQYLIHCRSGARSGRSLPIMQSVGLVNIIHMDNGFNSWKTAGLPVTPKLVAKLKN